MYKRLKTIVIALALLIVAAGIAIPVLASAQDQDQAVEVADQAVEVAERAADSYEAAQTPVSDTQLTAQASEKSSKSLSAAIVVGIAAAVGAISMGLAISKAVEGVARQPEAGSKIQTMLMLGLVFIETAIIYALIVAIMIIFVL